MPTPLVILLAVALSGCGLVLDPDPEPVLGGPNDASIDVGLRDTDVVDSVVLDAAPPDAITPAGFVERIFSGVGGAEALDVAVAAGGDVFVTGYFAGNVDFGTGVLVSERRDCFIARLTPELNTIWAQRVGGSSLESCNGIALTDGDGVIVVGIFENGDAYLGGTPIPYGGGQDGFVAEYDASTGAYRWSVGVTGSAMQTCADVAVVEGGRICVTGQMGGVTAFPPFSSFSMGRSDDAYLWCIASDGTASNLLVRAGGGASRGRALTVHENKIYLVGDFGGTVGFGTTQTSMGGRDGFIAAFEVAGSSLWGARVGGPGIDRIFSVATRSDGTPVVTGVFEETMQFGPDTVTSVGDTDAFVAAFGTTGAEVWARRMGTTGFDLGKDIAVGGGNVVAVGAITGALTFGGGSFAGFGGSDALAVGHTEVGDEVGAVVRGGPGDDVASAVALSPPNRAYVAGHHVIGGVSQIWIAAFDRP